MTDAADPDLFFGGALRLRQPPHGAHRAGTDAILLARLMTPEPGAVVYDLGAATGAVGLTVAHLSPGSRVVLVERDPTLAALAQDNIATNDLEERVSVIAADLLAPGSARHAAGLLPGSADLVLTNPPFFEGRGHRSSPDAGRAAAHAFPEAGGLDAWMRSCADLVRPAGRIGLIHRADALPACLTVLEGRFGECAVRPVHARADRPAIRVLISGRKGSRGPFRLLPPLVLQDAQGRFTPEVQALHGRAAMGQ
ncbi:tRNA1(Val) (adenine(37)-N6)-methyltransferase [Methylorubrum suomiense]|uniref:tRNA1(Val) (Adenine(37)-N6)-methyltransferase n=1 Tax=Methylorubrum suomiense TaxID=144191 RepID=A0ABQ4UXP9_9HYPH|nr:MULTISPECIES: methyltransferase [Methylobacteriaceae]GJE76908.1 tRNA1(Val) (adenine(37)-N6)-methyltransferase [Methylorubrum suomiense]